MLRPILSATTIALMCSAAYAADVPTFEPGPVMTSPVPMASNWTGFYIGVQGGYAFGGNSGDVAFDTDGDGAFDGDDDEFFSGDDLDGFTVGGKIGYDVQVNRFVVGLVADLNYLELETDYDFEDFEAPDAAFTLSEGVDWFATLRGRAGFLVTDNVLLYGHGGLAYSNVDFDGSFDDGDAATEDLSFSDDEDLWGWTVGAGVEAAVTSNIRVGLEYSYVDLGEGDWDDDDSDAFEFDGADIDFHTVRASASYKF